MKEDAEEKKKKKEKKRERKKEKKKKEKKGKKREKGKKGEILDGKIKIKGSSAKSVGWCKHYHDMMFIKSNIDKINRIDRIDRIDRIGFKDKAPTHRIS